MAGKPSPREDGRRPAVIFVHYRKDAFEASDYWVDGRMLRAIGQWRIENVGGPRFTSLAEYAWPIGQIRELRPQ